MTQTAPDSGLHAPGPRTNPGLLGHEEAERTLAEAAASGRLHHAWLISGPRGIGKATLAYRFARHLLASGSAADTGPGLFGPGEAPATGLYLDPGDPVFQRVSAGGHADLLTVERGLDEKTQRRRSEIVIADVRRVTGFLSLTASEGGRRVVVVDGAEEMNRNAANALLKTLEEPPANAVLLLVSHAPGRLLPTIRSRCRKLTLGPLDDRTVAELIARYRPDIPPADAQALTLIAEGSIGRALALAETGGVDLYGQLVGLLAGLPQVDNARLHETAEALASTRDETGAFAAFDVFTGLMTWWIARMVGARARGILPPEVVTGEAAVIERLSARGSLAQWVEVWEKITRLFDRTARVNLDRKQVLLNAFFALARVGN